MSEDKKKLAQPPDRLSMNPSSRFYDDELLSRGIGIRFKGKERTNVQEYCISEGWVKMVAGKQLNRMGQPLTIKTNGPVEAWFEDKDAEGADADHADETSGESDGKGASMSKAKSDSMSKVKDDSKSKVKGAAKSKVKGAAKSKVKGASKSQVKGAAKSRVSTAQKSKG